MCKGKSPQHYLSHDALENFEFMWEPVYVGRYDMPKMEPCHIEITENDKFLRFCDWRGVPDPENYIAHFFYDDYKFIQAWRSPEKYIDRLRRFKYVVAPGFSLYNDCPKPVQIIQIYRKQWLGAYYQSLGIKVIPCVYWGDKSTYRFCFEGVPKHSVICITSVGSMRHPRYNGRLENIFLDGFNYMMKKLQPTNILLYGPMRKDIEDCKYLITRLPTYYDVRRPYLDKLKEAKYHHDGME